jgi:hypothetical protein
VGAGEGTLGLIPKTGRLYCSIEFDEFREQIRAKTASDGFLMMFAADQSRLHLAEMAHAKRVVKR